MGINRNIVECKLPLIRSTVIVALVLIETLWNVNTVAMFRVVEVVSVLIETLWNVNCLSPFLTSRLSLY